MITMEDPRNRTRLRFAPHYGEVPDGFAVFLKPLWENVRRIYKMPSDEQCHSCMALDALLLVLYDRGVSFMSMSKAAGRSKTAAQKRVQRISIAQNLGLFYAGEDAPGALMRQNRVGVGDADYSSWIHHVGDVQPIEDEKFILVETGKSKISQWILEDRRVPGRPLLLSQEDIHRLLGDLSIPLNRYSLEPVHPRDLVVRGRADVDASSVAVSPYVSVPSRLLYVRGNPDTPKTPREAILSLPEPIQQVVTEEKIVRSVLER